MKQFPDVEFEVTWHSYMIDPSTPRDGQDYLAYCRKRWGGDGWTNTMRSSAKADGIDFANWKWWPHTLQAHRLIQYGHRHGRGSKLKEAVLVACYEKGENVSSKEVLIKIGEEVGLPNVRDYMTSDEGAKEVLEQDKKAKTEMDVSGVPYFIINGKHALNGANPTEHWVKVFKKLGA